MSDVFLCIECGRIGNKNSLIFYEMSVVGDEIIKKIMEVNHLGSFKCPVCNSSKVFYTRPETNSLCPAPTIVPYAPQPVEDMKAYTTINNPPAPLDPAGIGILDLPTPEEKPRPVVRFKNECDTCKEEFSSKINGATRCNACIRKLIR